MTDTRTLYRNARVHAPGLPGATAVAVEGARIVWVGDADRAPAYAGADEVVDLDGAWLAPAFVDAHVHATSTGLALSGLDLADAPSLAAALDRVARHAAATPSGVVLGTGWDETRWPERRPPTSAELDRAAPGRLVYLSRVDVHSAAVSGPLADAALHARSATGWDPSGWVRRDAHHAVRRTAYGLVPGEQRRAAQRLTRAHAAERGVGCLHECAGPDISGLDDCAGLLALAADEPGPEIVAYWGEAGADGVATARSLGAAGAAGDLFVDGAIGSRTAALCAPYADDPTTRGTRYHDADAVADHVAACTRAGLQAGFHVIGDDAVGTVLEGFRLAAGQVGLDAVRAARHRLEHVEMVTDVAALARYGIVASVQPAFDALWGGDAGMYAARLGTSRARTLNPFGPMAAAGVPLAIGSDAPVTPIDPWGGVRAGVAHSNPAFGLDPAAAFAAHTVGGWRAARVDDAGMLRPGARASFAVWAIEAVGAGDLPPLDGPAPQCVRTIVAGRTVFER